MTVYLKAAELLEEKGWTQGAYARNRKGDPTLVRRWFTPACFCAEGALTRCGASEEESLWLNFQIANANAAGSLIWNDTPGRTKQQVIEMFRRAHDLKVSGERG